MKTGARVKMGLVACVALQGFFVSNVLAQGCPRGGGGGEGAGRMTITGNVVPLMTPEVAHQITLQNYRQQMEMAYRQAAVLKQLQTATEQQETAAKEKSDQRKQRQATARQRREAELAKREERKAANLARLNADKETAARN
jgi:hypothetical protein